MYIETPDPNPVMPVLHSVARLVFPIYFSFLLVKFAFRLGRKKKRDKIFGGANLEVIKVRESGERGPKTWVLCSTAGRRGRAVSPAAAAGGRPVKEQQDSGLGSLLS